MSENILKLYYVIILLLYYVSHKNNINQSLSKYFYLFIRIKNKYISENVYFVQNSSN